MYRRYLKLDMCLFGYADLTTYVSVVAMTKKKGIPARKHLAQPAQYVGIIDNLMLDEFLWYAEQNLWTVRFPNEIKTLVQN